MHAVIDNERVLAAIKNGTITAGAASYPNLVDRSLLSMNDMDVLPLIGSSLEDRRTGSVSILIHILLSLAVAAKPWFNFTLLKVRKITITTEQTEILEYRINHPDQLLFPGVGLRKGFWLSAHPGSS